MRSRQLVELGRLVVGALVLAWLAGRLVWAEPKAADPPKPPPLTAEQKERLKERARYAEETTRLRREGKTADAIAAAEKLLAIEREGFGNVHGEVAGCLEILAEMHLKREEFPKARAAQQEVLAIRVKLCGEAH
jgi:hypothetical protein